MRRLLLSVLIALLPITAMAQSSQFGVRGLGQPGRSLSTRAFGTSGAFGLFDPESSLNPAALSEVKAVSAGFNGVQNYRNVENPAGSESVRSTRFPHVVFAGPVRRFPLVLGLSYSTYTDRDFTLASNDTLVIRDVPVSVSDTLSSRGGLSDLRLAASYQVKESSAVGAAFHVLTGSNRLASHRTFGDSAYLPISQEAELSFAGVGASVGAVQRLRPGIWVAAMARADGHANVDLDSARVSQVDLPFTFGLGFRVQASPKLDLATIGLFRTWSAANSDLLAAGGVGAENTFELAAGAEYTGDPKRPYRLPIRLGARYATLPFPLEPGQQPKEFGISLGTGTRFAQQRAGIDIGLEHVWRSAQGFKERAFTVSLGVGVRP